MTAGLSREDGASVRDGWIDTMLPELAAHLHLGRKCRSGAIRGDKRPGLLCWAAFPVNVSMRKVWATTRMGSQIRDYAAHRGRRHLPQCNRAPRRRNPARTER